MAKRLFNLSTLCVCVRERENSRLLLVASSIELLEGSTGTIKGRVFQSAC